jgi:uncharacterized damage-inducible protein DinB
MDIIIIAGLWLDGSSWADVVPVLERAGHLVHPLVLAGMDSVDVEGAGVTLDDHIAAAVGAIDAVDPSTKVVLVGHSARAAVADAAIDARPDRIERGVYVGGFPAERGAERAIPSLARGTRDPQRPTDERRHDVPVTVIAAELASGASTRPADLGRAIAAAIGTQLDEQDRPEPPIARGEIETVLAFLDHERASVAWKTSGLDAVGLAATTAASSMTLGGLLKHMTYVEDLWCSRRLHGRPPAPPWDAVDWDADRDWDWHPAAADTPEALVVMWRDAVRRSRIAVAAALTDGGLDHRAAWVDDWYGEAPTLRWILLHMIREYARHVGHADLLRESVDGATGE